METQKLYPHTALFNQVEKILRDLFRPHDPRLDFNCLIVRKDESNSYFCVWRHNIRCFDEHTGCGDIFCKGDPIGLLNPETDGDTFFMPFDVAFFGHYAEPPAAVW